MNNVIEIDGSLGEGGGQVLRSSLSLSMFLQQPFTIKNIRAGRPRPGLMRQHITAVKAAAKICNAKVKGAEISSLKIEFYPGKVQTGTYKFDVGSAGSTTLVLQTLLPVLMVAEGTTEISLSGGTHNQYSPPLDFLVNTFLKQINKMGPRVSVDSKAYGFYPVGGGMFTVKIDPVKELKQIEILSRGKNIGKKAFAYSSKINEEIGENEMIIVAKKLGWIKENCESVMVESPGPGNVVMLIDENEHTKEVLTGFGRKLYVLKRVVADAIAEYSEYVQSEVPVYKYLADQLIIPMVIAGAGRFITSEPSLHTLTNIEVVEKFLTVDVSVNKLNQEQWLIDISSKN
jgi:RNA 3'-terminal phosphate cyclase (ATP)